MGAWATPIPFNMDEKEQNALSIMLRLGCMRVLTADQRQHHKEYCQKYYIRNREKLLARSVDYGKNHYRRNRQRILARHRKYYEANKDKKRLYDQQRRRDCAERLRDIQRRYYLNHRQQILARQKQYYQNNPEALRLRKEANREYQQTHRQQTREKAKRYRQRHLEAERIRVKLSARRWRKHHPDRMRDSNRKHRLKHPEAIKERARRYYVTNRVKIHKVQREQYRNNPNIRLSRQLPNRLRSALHSQSKTASALQLLGCSIHQLKRHLESLFKPGMNWDNYGKGWHIDHRRPVSRFDLRDPEQQKACFHWTNLQPLWAMENIRKSNKYEIATS